MSLYFFFIFSEGKIRYSLKTYLCLFLVMDDVYEETREILEEKSGLKSSIEEIYKIDRDKETWTFHDISVDSGVFGELVSRGIIEKKGGRYRLKDRKAVKSAIKKEKKPEKKEHSREKYFSNNIFTRLKDFIGKISNKYYIYFLFLFGGFSVLFFRGYMYKKIFRGGDIVLSGNDPYFYRYLVENNVLENNLIGVFYNLPRSVENGEPLMVSTLSLFSEVLGGTPKDTGMILAIYPVISALITAIIIYFVTLKTSNDRLIATSSLFIFSVLPTHTLRTSLGFADHHGFDYLWLSITLLGLVLLSEKRYREKHDLKKDLGLKEFVYISILGVGVSGQTLAWEGGPLLLGVVFVYIFFRGILDLYLGVSPLFSNIPILTGLLVGGIISSIFHIGIGWQKGVVGFFPLILLVLGVSIVGLTEISYRYGFSIVKTVGFVVSVFVFYALVFLFFIPEYIGVFQRNLDVLFGLSGSLIYETRPLFSPRDVFLPIKLIGLFGVISIIYMCYFLIKSFKKQNPRLLCVCIFGLYFLFLSLIQNRFAGQLSLIIPIVMSIGLIDIGQKLKIIKQKPLFRDSKSKKKEGPNKSNLEGNSFSGFFDVLDLRSSFLLVVLFLVLGSTNIGYTYVLADDSVIPQNQHSTAKWMESYSERQGWSYPQNYVFSDWDKNRHYNYFVNGQSRSYGFAQNNYNDFIVSSSPKKWYNRLKDRVGFIVMDPFRVKNNYPETMYSRLQQNLGSNNGETPGVGNYRILYINKGIRVFSLVPGVKINGTENSNTSFYVYTNVSIENVDQKFLYKRKVKTDKKGRYTIQLAHPGIYKIGNKTFEVTEKQILNGEKINID